VATAQPRPPSLRNVHSFGSTALGMFTLADQSYTQIHTCADWKYSFRYVHYTCSLEV